jgi:virulence factor srfB
MEHSLIANSGIQIITFPLKINTQEKFKMWYHEWYDTENGEWHLDPAYELRTDDECYYYNKYKLHKGGYLSDSTIEINVDDLKNDGILPLRIEDENCTGVKGDIFSMTFADRDNKMSMFENVWLPVPYFFKRTPKRFKFGPLNWARVKLLPKGEEKGQKLYDVLLAFDTRTRYENDEYDECPVFPDVFRGDMDFELCSNEFLLMDFCSPGNTWSYIDEYLLHLVHPGIARVSQIKGANVRRMSYIASYVFLINYLAQKKIFPKIKLYKDTDVEIKDVDMVVDIGNSRTTALLIEDNTNFNQVRQLELIDYTNLIKEAGDTLLVNRHNEPFDMRLAFRKVDFGNFGIKDSKQFVYPSLIRLGQEANTLIHLATNSADEVESLSTYSSPKRYLWDWRPNKEEWKFLVLDGEKDDHILNVRGITNQLKSDGKLDLTGESGSSFHYSRRSLMTFSFLEMLVQAKTQINGEGHRSNKRGFGRPSMPRRIRRIIVTCPTAMSKVEREALIHCAKDAVILLENFEYKVPSDNPKPGSSVEVIPAIRSMKDEDGSWYYDEASCSQLVYMYGEVGHKYKGCSQEFFNLYGKVDDGDVEPSITVGSLDIGAGTSDLMISKYTYIKGDITTITPDPKFYDSYYFAGDDMLYALIKNVMLLDENSAFRTELKSLSTREYRQKIKDFFGEDYNGQTISDRVLRKDFNIQYSIPLMCYFLELLKQDSKDCVVKYSDVFVDSSPNNVVIEEFKRKMNIDVTTLSWRFNKAAVSEVVHKEFEPLLKKVATIMYSFACDVVLLSGRPASLPAIRDIFLKYYSVSPNRLIVLNDYYVGNWYPFSKNTGYIKNAKTIVAMGGIIGHYASELSNLNKFVINLDLLKKNLKSTTNYIEISREGQSIEYFITPEQNRGEITISSIPATLNVRQIGMDSYPCRALYSIDFNRHKIADKIRKKAILNDEGCPTDAKIMGLVNETIDTLKKRMPFNVTIERDAEDKENLRISSIVDKEGNDVMDGNLEIHIQSLGVDEQYWLDSGAFDF